MARRRAPAVEDRLLSAAEARRYLGGMSEREFRRLCDERELAVVRRGQRGHIRVRLSELDRWIGDHTIPARQTQ